MQQMQDSFYCQGHLPRTKQDTATGKPMNKAEQYIYRVEWSPEDSSFVATCAEFPSLSFLDGIQTEAFVGIINLVRDVVADMQKREEFIPEPFCLRPPVDMEEGLEKPDHQATIQDLTAKLRSAKSALTLTANWDGDAASQYVREVAHSALQVIGEIV
jgi:hypothetical protein